MDTPKLICKAVKDADMIHILDMDMCQWKYEAQSIARLEYYRVPVVRISVGQGRRSEV